MTLWILSNSSNDNLSEDGSELSTQRSERSPGRRKKKLHKLKLKDGSIIVLNPPEELLKRSESKARKHAGLRQVGTAVSHFAFQHSYVLTDSQVTSTAVQFTCKAT